MSEQYIKIKNLMGNISTGQTLLLLLCLGFFIRLYVVMNAVTLSVDSTLDLKLAKAFSEWNFYGGLDMNRPPLHPILVSLTYPIFQDYEFAARIISLIFGTLVIPVSFYLGRFIYNERAGLVTAFFTTVHPYMVRYSGDTLREGLYYFLVATVTFFGLKAVFKKSIGFMFLAGLFSVLAYLTKPGAIGLLVIISFWAVLHDIRHIKEDWRKRLLTLASGWAVFILIALPYLLFIFNETGTVAITGKISVSSIPKEAVFNMGEKFILFLKHFPEAFSIPFFIFFLWGIYKRKSEGFTKAEYFIISILVSFSLLYLGVNPRRRYFVQLMPMVLVLASMGFLYVEKWLKVSAKEKAHLIVAALILVITAIQLPRGMVSLKKHHLPEKLAGQWLLENEGRGTTILTRKPIVVFYAQGNFVALTHGKLKDVIKYGRANGAEYLAGYPPRLKKIISDLDKEKDRLLVEVNSFKGEKGEKFIVYRFSP